MSLVRPEQAQIFKFADRVTVDELKEIYQLMEIEVETAAKQNEILVLMGDFNFNQSSVLGGTIAFFLVLSFNQQCYWRQHKSSQ